MSLDARIEALLFAANAPLDAGEISELLDEAILDVKRSIQRLEQAYARRRGALEVATFPKGRNKAYILQIREEYMGAVSRLLPPAIDDATLETLGLIALNQPVRQSELVKTRGPKAYDHIRELVRLRLVKKHQAGSTFSLRTTRRFAEEIQVEDDPERIKEVLATRNGRIP